MRGHQEGFTIIEMMIVLAIFAIILFFMVPMISEPIRNAKIKGAVEQAKEVVAACNLVRMTPVSSFRDPVNLKVTHTYGPEYTGWTDVSILKSKLSTEYDLPALNPFDKPYLFKMTQKACSVAVELDQLVDGWEGYAVETAGSSTRIIVSTSTRSTSGPAWVQHQKQFLTGETVR